MVQFWPRGHRLASVYLAFAIAIVATIVICLHNMFFFNRSRQVNLFARRYISSSLLSAFAITFSSCSRQKLILAVLFLVFADEPVTEAYSVLGFPLWWSTRFFFFFAVDAICKTCYYRRYELAHPGLQKKFACGHDNVRILCRACYQQVSCVVHPYIPRRIRFWSLSTATIDHCG